jgi:hypothetical protein
MRAQIPIASLVILIGGLETAGGAQELVYRGILQSETEPLIMGTFGTLAGVLLVAAGVALLVSSKYLIPLVQATAYVSVPVFILLGIVKHYAGWPITAVGILLPLFLVFYCQKPGKDNRALSKA